MAKTSTGIGVRLREARALTDMSARELDRLAVITEGHTSIIESGVDNPTADTLRRLSGVLGISLDWLVSGEGKAPSERSVRTSVESARNRAA